jgi:hypothetical protein
MITLEYILLEGALSSRGSYLFLRFRHNPVDIFWKKRYFIETAVTPYRKPPLGLGL